MSGRAGDCRGEAQLFLINSARSQSDRLPDVNFHKYGDHIIKGLLKGKFVAGRLSLQVVVLNLWYNVSGKS